ncbi:MAG TPA: hypothetical protein VGR15_07040 [Bacteroidota bacterium]|nr:hypothetical protein [Bacteroidota bacterium]
MSSAAGRRPNPADKGRRPSPPFHDVQDAEFEDLKPKPPSESQSPDK